MVASICFITAVYGNYEASCKRFMQQTVDTDFVCFTDNAAIISNGWSIDTTPYHVTHKSPLDKPEYVNSMSNNAHTFNIAKYYKQAFANIPSLAQYEVIVWVDGTIEIVYDKTSEYVMAHIRSARVIGWHHEYRGGLLSNEVAASHHCDRYLSTRWHNQAQPYQDVDAQYRAYVDDGYTDSFYRELNAHTPHMGVWITCFVAFLHKDTTVRAFLDAWYLQTLKYTTQDQIGFSYVCQKTNLVPFTLPNAEISGARPHASTMFYHKHSHGM